MTNDDETIDHGRRRLLSGAASGVVATAFGTRVSWAQSSSLPESGDVLVYASGDNASQAVDPAALEPLKAVLAFPKSSSGAVRDSKESTITLVKVPEGELDDSVAGAAAGDIVAMSAVCSHQGCLVDRVGSLGEASGKLNCVCHGSVFEPRNGGDRVSGPAPRGLPTLPITEEDGKLVVIGEFEGRVGV